MARVESGRSRGAGGLTIVSMLSDFEEVLRPFVQRRLQDGTLNRPHTMCVRTLGGSKSVRKKKKLRALGRAHL